MHVASHARITKAQAVPWCVRGRAFPVSLTQTLRSPMHVREQRHIVNTTSLIQDWTTVVKGGGKNM